MKRLLIDKNINESSKQCLKNLGFALIETTEICQIKNSTSTHPDMQFLKIGDSTAVVEQSVYSYYESVLPDYNLTAFDGVGNNYPDDSILNIVTLGDKTILTPYQHKKLSFLNINNPVFVKQGYVKCNICVLNANAVITSDYGIKKSLENFGIRVYLLPCEQILLKGYKNGFWGGCSGNFGNIIYFNGDITKLDCYSQLVSVLQKEKIEPIYNHSCELCDNGSILYLD